MQDQKVPTVDELLEKSSATDEFKEAVRELSDSHSPNGRISFGPGNPPVKVLRAICQLLESQPDLAIENVAVNGRSGCSDYHGTLEVNDGEHKFSFNWNCAWKAQQMGWTDYFGSPDQIRAARTFGYQCFERFEKA